MPWSLFGLYHLNVSEQCVSDYVHVCFSYRVKVAFAGKTVAVVVKSNKTLQDAIATMLNKYHLRAQDATVTMVRGV